MPITQFYVHNMRDSSWKCCHEYPLYFLVYTFCDNGGLDGEEKRREERTTGNMQDATHPQSLLG